LKSFEYHATVEADGLGSLGRTPAKLCVLLVLVRWLGYSKAGPQQAQSARHSRTKQESNEQNQTSKTQQITFSKATC
jgi:hypothetical protein